ncbi:rubrerythrin family protein [Bacillus sp. BA3]|uniref:ferritin-like domain-containing protein n=1 Tax=Bacillaceae TaxID=186817 RepID=UPI000C32C172|nr:MULTISPECIES: ferritin-like domain-containing protein [Bacillaceae]MCT4478825.1 ferritin-like domain-containing protein [Peribacillus frigoritolerans]PKF89384.1 rubrerythrin family protein [Bacillus sp. BA3]
MYGHDMYEGDWNRQQDMLIQLEKAINGEYSAIQCYEKLAALAPDEKQRKQIIEIREDEIKHFQAFTRIYNSLTGMQPQPKVTEPCPDSYADGLEFAVQDEQETVDFYQDVADGAADRTIRKAFRRAAADEQNHAVWFLFYLVKLKG